MPKGIYLRKPRSEEHKANLSKSLKGKIGNRLGSKLTEETKEKMRISHLGNKNHLGHKHSEDSRQKMRIGVRKYYANLKAMGLKPVGFKGGYENKPNERYSKIKLNGGSHTSEEWHSLKESYGYTCPSCLKKEPEIKLTIDHIIPVSKGGTDDIGNIQPLCKSCNSRKKNRFTVKYPRPAQSF